MPASCAGAFASPSEVTLAALYSCPALSSLATNFTSTDCPASFSKVCQAEYTDNPPYSCTRSVSPEFLTTLGSSLGNASAMWSLTVIIIALSLKRAYPGGILYRTYKVDNHRVYESEKVVPITNEEEADDKELKEYDSVPQTA